MEALASYTRLRKSQKWLIATPVDDCQYMTVLVARKSKEPQAVLLGNRVTAELLEIGEIPSSAQGQYLYEIEQRYSPSETSQWLRDQGESGSHWLVSLGE